MKSFLTVCLLVLIAAVPLAAQVEIDNDWVRVTRTKGDTGMGSFLARGPSAVVYLTDCHARMIDMLGVSQEIRRKAGDVSYVNLGLKQVQNLSRRPIEAVVIELKQDPSHAAPVALDPVKLDPRHHIVLLENDRVRAIKTILDPHLKAPMHEHPHYVVVYLTELHTTMAMADGRNIDNVRRPGEIAWRDALKHATENVGDRTAMEIQVELK